MKKFYIFALCAAASCPIWAVELPQPTIEVLPSQLEWFDGFAVSWFSQPNVPYALTILDSSGISVVKNEVEDLDIADVSLTEFQESEDSQNYPNAQLQITLAMIEAQIGSYYTLTIPAGTISVIISDEESLPNDEIVYSFQLKDNGDAVALPEPNIEPMPGKVSELSQVKLSWTGVLGSLDLLNPVSQLPGETSTENVSVTYNGAELENPEILFEWSSRLAMTSGSAGDIMVISLVQNEEVLVDGVYVITIPEGYLQISDIETGTLYNDEIILAYELVSDDAGISTLKPLEGESKIFKLNGQEVKSNVDSLEEGVYIINGKKIIIK